MDFKEFEGHAVLVMFITKRIDLGQVLSLLDIEWRNYVLGRDRLTERQVIFMECRSVIPFKGMRVFSLTRSSIIRRSCLRKCLL